MDDLKVLEEAQRFARGRGPHRGQEGATVRCNTRHMLRQPRQEEEMKMMGKENEGRHEWPGRWLRGSEGRLVAGDRERGDVYSTFEGRSSRRTGGSGDQMLFRAKTARES